MTPLAELLGAAEVDTFLARRWPEHHTVTHGPIARLPEFLRSPLLANPRELARAYRGSVQVTNLGIGQYPIDLGPDPSVYFEDLKLSVKFANLEPLLPGARAWLRDLEVELGVPRGAARISAFANAPGSGLVVHCDRTEQFAINLVGDKRFRVKPSPLRFARMKHSPRNQCSEDMLLQAPDGLPTWKSLANRGTTHLLKPGSVLFTPRGLYHETLASNGVSLTVVIAIEHPNPAELISSYLHAYLMQSPRWRAPLRAAWSPAVHQREPAKRQLRGLLAELAGQLEHLDLDVMLGGHGAHALRASDLTQASRFQRDRAIPIALGQSAGGAFTVAIPRTPANEGCTQDLPRELRPVVRWIAGTRAPFSLAALCARYPRWEPSALAAVLVFLVRSRAVRALPVEPFADRRATRRTRPPS